jgi:hypothetical protein
VRWKRIWTLFVADLSGGDTHTLSSWGLTLTGVPVPEPGTAALLPGGPERSVVAPARQSAMISIRLGVPGI